MNGGPAPLPRTRRAGANNTPRRWDDGAEPEGLSHERFHQCHPPPTNKVNGVDGLLFPKPTALNTVIACRQEGFVTEALEQALTCSFVQMGFMVEEGLQSNGLQERSGSLSESLGGSDCVLAVLAGEVGVTPVQFDYGPAAVADEGEAWVAEAGFDWLELEGLGSTGMGEFHGITGKAEARQLRVSEADIGGRIGFVVAGDMQVIDVNLGQFLSDRARVTALGIAFGY